MLRAALRDLQWRWKRFVIAVVGVALVFAMGLIMTGLSESFSARGRSHAASDRRRGVGRLRGRLRPVHVVRPAAGRCGRGPEASPVIVLRQTIADGDTLADVIVVGVEPGRLGAPRADRGDDIGGPGDAVIDDSLTVAGLGDTLLDGRRAVPCRRHGLRVNASTPVCRSCTSPLADAQSMVARGQPVATAFLFAVAAIGRARTG